MGPYCQFCGTRCFVRITEKWPSQIRQAYGRRTMAATCPGGQAFDKKVLGVCYDDAVAAMRRGFAVGGGSTAGHPPVYAEKR